jgi:hypothetical protein
MPTAGQCIPLQKKGRVLYGCETWSDIREERRVRVFENRVLRRIFGPKRDEVRRKLRKPHNEELHEGDGQGM